MYFRNQGNKIAHRPLVILPHQPHNINCLEFPPWARVTFVLYCKLISGESNLSICTISLIPILMFVALSRILTVLTHNPRQISRDAKNTNVCNKIKIHFFAKKDTLKFLSTFWHLAQLLKTTMRDHKSLLCNISGLFLNDNCDVFSLLYV